MQWFSGEQVAPLALVTTPNAGTEFEGIASRGLLGTLPDGDVASPDQGPFGPQAFLIDTPPGASTLGVHFHEVDQVQYIAYGSGRVGRHDVAAGAVHYRSTGWFDHGEGAVIMGDSERARAAWLQFPRPARGTAPPHRTEGWIDRTGGTTRAGES
ncbi:MAG TPA: hypothetical protein VEK09_09760 [Jatrophihabitantaceae bacterium]|nr:hypothetical protein [Jatrophihabitantaceae bacterium]